MQLLISKNFESVGNALQKSQKLKRVTTCVIKWKKDPVLQQVFFYVFKHSVGKSYILLVMINSLT